MGIRSDVGFACKSEIAKQVDELFPWVKEDADTVSELPEGTLYHFCDIKWHYELDKDIMALYAWLKERNEDDYLIVEACGEYPESEEGDLGDWLDNPWNMRRRISVSISFEA